MGEQCVCGHVADEHEENSRGQLADCTVKGCECICFESDDEDDEDSSGGTDG